MRRRGCTLDDLLGTDRISFLFACAWYVILWGPTGGRYERLVHKARVRLGATASLETEDCTVKEAYGAIVRREQRLYVAFGRYAKRAKKKGLDASWPGTNNMRGGVHAWAEEKGILDAMLCYV